MTRATDDQINALIEAMENVLDDWGHDRNTVCQATKAAARIAFEPFLIDPELAEFFMPLVEAQRIVDELSQDAERWAEQRRAGRGGA